MDKLNTLFQTETGRAVIGARFSLATAEGNYANAKTFDDISMWSNEIERRIDALIVASMEHQKHLTEQAMLQVQGSAPWKDIVSAIRNS